MKKDEKNIRYSGIQPQYFPRLHYFARVLNADIFTIRDDAQFVRKHKYPDGTTDKSYQADSPIKQAFGRFLLSVPISHKSFLPIHKTEIDYKQDWSGAHLKTLQFAYSNAPYFSENLHQLEIILKKKYKNLAELNNIIIFWAILKLLKEPFSEESLNLEHINSILKKQNTIRLKEIRLGSESKALKNTGNITANEKILLLIKEVGANEDYCGGTGVAAYVDHSLFEKNGIKITVQDWTGKPYPQLFTKQQGFIQNLSIIDLLMNVSSQEAVKILK